MKVAVTGATGFIGRHVVHALHSSGAEIVAISRTPSHLFDQQNIEVVAMDMADCGTDPFARIGCPDLLIHLAWGGLPNYRAESHLETELPVQETFLGTCIRSGLRRLMVAGTCLEYGMQSGALDEDLPANPVTSYGKAKNALRQNLERLQNDYSFELTWLRTFYLYGPGQAQTSLFSQLQNAIAANARAFAMSPGDQVRDFMPVEQAARCIVDLGLLGANGGIVNLCSGQPETVLGMVRRWMQEWNASLELRPGVYAYLDYEPFAFWGTRTKLDRLLGETK